MRCKMKDEHDAYGHLIYDFFDNKNPREIVERDDGFICQTSGPESYFQEFNVWAKHHQDAMKFVKGKVIDIGCGAGKHSLYLQEKGFDVLSVDVSPLAVSVCKKRCLKNTRLLPITKLSSKLGKFDTILMLGNNFGLFGSYKRAQWLLKKFNNMTNKNGIIIAETSDPYKTDEKEHLTYHQFNKQRERMSGQLRIRVRYKNYKSPWFDYLFVSKAEMQNILNESDWKIGQFVEIEDPRYIAIIKKK